MPWLILLHGVGLGIGGGTLYWPVMVLVAEWFVRRRGLAGGIIFAGSGVGGQSQFFELEHVRINSSNLDRLRVPVLAQRTPGTTGLWLDFASMGSP